MKIIMEQFQNKMVDAMFRQQAKEEQSGGTVHLCYVPLMFCNSQGCKNFTT